MYNLKAMTQVQILFWIFFFIVHFLTDLKAVL